MTNGHRAWVAWLLIAAGSAGCLGDDDPAPSSEPEITTATRLGLKPIVTGLDQPLFVTPHPHGGLAIVERTGQIKWLASNATAIVIADMADLVGSQGAEQGLLGLAFQDDETAYVSYTDPDGTSTLASSRLLPDGSIDVGSLGVLLRVDQPFSNHNGGMIAFGPDGYLYYGLGDGGLAGDPQGNGQNPTTLLGSILRLDVTPGAYTVPPDNPFVGHPVNAPEVWAYGLRNPWRFSFDSLTGDLWIGDVGQDRIEEIDHAAAGQGAGTNFGWNPYEGPLQYPTGISGAMLQQMFTYPVAYYEHDEGCSVTGGYVVRDPALPDLFGAYLYGDFCSGTIWVLDGPTGTPARLMETDLMISSFGQDADGGIYVIHFGGDVLRLTMQGA